jgi:hypothetical protein
MDGTPNTFNYLVGGYVFFTVIMVIYISSLYSRWKGLRREEQMLAELDQPKTGK